MLRRGNWKIRILIGLAIVAFAYFKRCSNTEVNPYTQRYRRYRHRDDIQRISKCVNQAIEPNNNQ